MNHELFDPTPSRARQRRRRALRAQLGLAASTRVVLFAGKFVPAKQPRELLEAFLTLNLPDTALRAGRRRYPEKMPPSASAPAPRRQPAAVHFLPFANQSEMPSRYLLADLFVLPSRGLYETWGLAVNEAMHLGRPCLVSDRVGCQRDLVTEGDTGWVFSADDPAQLRAKLADALTADLAPFKSRVAARVAGYTYAQTTAGLLAALANLPGTRS